MDVVMKLHLPMIATALAFLATGSVLAADPLRDQMKGLFEAIPEAPPVLPGEPPTPDKLALGKMLYFDPRISESHDISCSTCHNIGMGGVDGRMSSRGHNGRVGGRKVPTVLNAVFNKTQFWDGRASDLKEQVVSSVMAFPEALLKSRGGLTTINPEMTNITKQHAVEQLKGIPGYVDAFKKAFPSEADPIVYDNIGRAIAVFETTLITPDSPFDRWLNGDDKALSENQKQGLKIFVDKGCSSCHSGTNIGGGMYTRFGVVQNPGSTFLPPDDWGRFMVTKNISDKYVFKVPTLRNVELTAPYFHSGSTWDLKEAVAVMGEAQLGQKLTEGETDKIAEFLKSLTGRQPEVVLPILPPRVAATPRPEP
jgi:cytochrome c peroxidase